MLTDIIIRDIEEHIIKLQNEDVQSGTSRHAETIKLLREAKQEMEDLPRTPEDAHCDSCGYVYDSCSRCTT